MDATFWQEKWARNEIAFHQPQANPLLVAHLDSLRLTGGSRLFVPLCGKTLDIPWLLARGYRIAGAELSELAVEQLFSDLGATPRTTASGRLTRYSAPGIDIFQGDIFDLTRTDLGPVDAVYDRAALIALPADLRTRYARHLAQISDHAMQLLISITYEQHLAAGPPFSVDDAEIDRLYGEGYELRVLGGVAVDGGLKGKWPATDRVWLLAPRR